MPEIKPFTAIETISHKTGARPLGEAPPAAEVPIEVAPVAMPAPEQPKDLDNERFAALTKKERENQKYARALKERERSVAKWEEADKLATTNKLEALKRLGISYDEITNLHLSQMSAEDHTPEAIAVRKAQEAARQEVELFRKEQAAQHQELQQQQYQQAKVQIQNEAKTLTTARPEDFAYINAESAHDIVVELIEQTYFNDGRLMPVSEAAEEIEKYLENKYEKISQVPKFRSRYMPAEVQESKPLGANPPENTQKPQTLTHRNTTAPVKPRTYTAQERRDRAIRILNGQPVD